jgi:hypothetical protein
VDPKGISPAWSSTTRRSSILADVEGLVEREAPGSGYDADDASAGLLTRAEMDSL